jgi:hypothetical protein
MWKKAQFIGQLWIYYRARILKGTPVMARRSMTRVDATVQEFHNYCDIVLKQIKDDIFY